MLPIFECRNMTPRPKYCCNWLAQLSVVHPGSQFLVPLFVQLSQVCLLHTRYEPNTPHAMLSCDLVDDVTCCLPVALCDPLGLSSFDLSLDHVILLLHHVILSLADWPPASPPNLQRCQQDSCSSCRELNKLWQTGFQICSPPPAVAAYQKSALPLVAQILGSGTYLELSSTWRECWQHLLHDQQKTPQGFWHPGSCIPTSTALLLQLQLSSWLVEP